MNTCAAHIKWFEERRLAVQFWTKNFQVISLLEKKNAVLPIQDHVLPNEWLRLQQTVLPSHSWKRSICTAGQQISLPLWNQNINCCVYGSPPLDYPELSESTPLHSLPPPLLRLMSVVFSRLNSGLLGDSIHINSCRENFYDFLICLCLLHTLSISRYLI
jgi:hypothetical protein